MPSARWRTRASVSALARHFGIDTVETEGVMRGRATAASVSPDDLVAACEWGF